MRLALGQINPTVGDIAGNAERMMEMIQQARGNADLIVFPECCLVGYPPLDLLERGSFIQASAAGVQWLIDRIPSNISVIFGAPIRSPHAYGKPVQNAAILVDDGEMTGTAAKILLPTYDVFDEYRYFEPGHACLPMVWKGLRLGVHVCEDMWNNESWSPYRRYSKNPVDELAEQNIDLFINISASPFAIGKIKERDGIIRDYCRRHRRPFVYVNQVGANTELVFDGSSCAFDSTGALQVRAASFREELVYWTPGLDPLKETPRSDIVDLHDALVLGVRDYFHKTGIFKRAVVGLSGGIDSAVTCAIAATALGPDRVLGIAMPSRYSSEGSVSDAVALAENLGIELQSVPIEPAVASFNEMLSDLFAGTKPGVAEENIQARVRGATLMALCNKFSHLLLTTGNKSELATGYATLYGDMSGGLAVLSDVFKTQVYELAAYINERAGREVIPQSTITKPPSAELRPDQKDSDSLPPYEVLDDILSRYIEDAESRETIAMAGHDERLVDDVLRMVDRNEYKRRQAAPGIRVTNKAFGLGRRLPIVMRWRPIESRPDITTAGK
ncbi:MAG: NAD+ synthase [Rhodothermales bacterium]